MGTVSNVRSAYPSSVQVAPITVHRSRWGHHPCSWEMFQKLKKLNKAYQRAYRQFLQWNRWHRKEPQNRVLRRSIRNDKGWKIGSEVVGPRPEPFLHPLFTRRSMERDVVESTVLGREIENETVGFVLLPVQEDLWNARHPVATPEELKPLQLSEREVDDLLRQLGD